MGMQLPDAILPNFRKGTSHFPDKSVPPDAIQIAVNGYYGDNMIPRELQGVTQIALSFRCGKNRALHIARILADLELIEFTEGVRSSDPDLRRPSIIKPVRGMDHDTALISVTDYISSQAGNDPALQDRTKGKVIAPGQSRSPAKSHEVSRRLTAGETISNTSISSSSTPTTSSKKRNNRTSNVSPDPRLRETKTKLSSRTMVKETIREAGEISTAGLLAQTGIPKPTLHRILKELTEDPYGSVSRPQRGWYRWDYSTDRPRGPTMKDYEFAKTPIPKAPVVMEEPDFTDVEKHQEWMSLEIERLHQEEKLQAEEGRKWLYQKAKAESNGGAPRVRGAWYR